MGRKYLDFYEQMKEDIVSGIYENGMKLPSKRLAAEENGISIITVEHAYELLTDEGYIESRQRSGYFVIYSEGEFFTGERGPGKNVSGIREGEESGNPHTNSYILPAGKDRKENHRLPAGKDRKETRGLPAANDTEENRGLSPAIFAKTARRVLTHYEHEITEKSPAFGSAKLRAAIRNYLLRNRHIRVDTDQIVIGAGAEYLYGMIVRLLGRDRIYGLESPGYQRIEDVYKTDGVKTELLVLGKDGIESRALKKTKAEILHITPYRSYPTGVTATAGKKKEYLKWCEHAGGIIIEDDAESEFTPLKKPEDTLFSMDTNGRVLYVNTFTKTIGPSIRMAYMLLPKRMVQIYEERVGFYSCPVPVLEQYIVAELIENGDFERHINRVRRQNRMLKKGVTEREG